MRVCVILSVLLAVTAAFPADPIIYKLDEQRYHYTLDGDGIPHLVDLWVKTSDLEKMSRYNPDSQNIYHLFTRSDSEYEISHSAPIVEKALKKTATKRKSSSKTPSDSKSRSNPTLSQVLVSGNTGTVSSSNYDARRRTAVVIHGWRNSATSDVNSVIVPAYLNGEDMNVIVVDWNAGAGTIDYTAAVGNTLTSGQSVARFLNWLVSATNGNLASFVIAGHSLGGHQSGIVGRNLGGQVSSVTALDPALLGWITNEHAFRSTDGIYTEVIHTSAGVTGLLTPHGDADFYPNGGINMPGCDGASCDHSRSYYYFAESLSTGGFTGQRCATFLDAGNGNCNLSGSLNMGGIRLKTGQSGIFYLETNAGQPFSRG